MSVDYYSCTHCGAARYEEAIQSCEECWEGICNNCIIIDKNIKFDWFFPSETYWDDWLKKQYCPICVNKAIQDANPNKDFIWNALNIWDAVVFCDTSKTSRWLNKWIIDSLSKDSAMIKCGKWKTRKMKKFIIKI